MRYEKDNFGMGTSTSASLLERLRAIDTQYAMRAYDHATLKKAQNFIWKVWELHLEHETIPRGTLAELFDTIKLR